MTGYIILIALAVYGVSVLIAFLSGHAKGRKAEQIEQDKERIRKAESDRAYQIEKEKIMKEAFGDAEKRKAHLSDSGNSVDKFDAINDSLRNNKN